MNEAGSLEQDDVIGALDHARIARGAGRRGRNGARPASRAHEHVHRAGAQRPFQDRQDLGAIEQELVVAAPASVS